MHNKVIALTNSKGFTGIPVNTFIDPEIDRILDELFMNTDIEEQELISRLLSMEAPALSRDDMLFKVVKRIPELQHLLKKYPMSHSSRNRDMIEIKLMKWCEDNMEKLNEENLEEIFYSFKLSITTYTLQVRLIKSGLKDIVPYWVIR